MTMRLKYILYALCFVLCSSSHAAAADAGDASFQSAIDKLESLKSLAVGPARSQLRDFLTSQGYAFDALQGGWIPNFSQFKNGKITAADLLHRYNVQGGTAQRSTPSNGSTTPGSGQCTSSTKAESSPTKADSATTTGAASTDYNLAIENRLVQRAASSGSKEAVLEQLELYFPKMIKSDRQKILQHFAAFLGDTGPVPQPRQHVGGAAAAAADDGPVPAAPLSFGRGIIAHHSGVYSTGFDGDPQCSGHYQGFYPKAPVIHNYFPAILNIANNFTLRFPTEAYDLLPIYVKTHFAKAGLTEIFVVTQAYAQIIQDQGGNEGVICFRPQTWISPSGGKFNAAADVQMIDWQHNVHQLKRVGYSIHDGVSSPCAPDVRGILNLESAIDHTRLVWSRTQHGGRVAITAHLFVPDRFTTFVHDRAPAGRELQAVIQEVKVHIPAVRRVLEEDLGDLLR